MQSERDVLVKRVFPALRAKFRLRGIEILEVDLRWGITREQAESGQILPICLAEIDRCRPFFIGILGERYGWRPPVEAFTPALRAAYPFLTDAVGRSVTEIEFLHGGLAQDRDVDSALFFEREGAPTGDRDDDEGRRLQDALKRRLRASGARLRRYRDAETLGDDVAAELADAIERRFPSAAPLDPAAREDQRHRSFARPHLRPLFGFEAYRARLDALLEDAAATPLIVTGASGAGKTALLAHWAEALAADRPGDWLFVHFLEASPDGSSPRAILRRIWQFLDRVDGAPTPQPGDDVDLVDLAGAFAGRLEKAAAAAAKADRKIVLALDGLDRLESGDELHWLPISFPPRVVVVVSSSDGHWTRNSAEARGFDALEIRPLDSADRRRLADALLARWGKALSPARLDRVLAHPRAGSPLFLKVVLEELRASAIEDRLDAALDNCLAASDEAALYGRVLDRLEQDLGRETVAAPLRMVWASVKGLEEAEIVSASGVAPLDWSVLRNALGDAFFNYSGRLLIGQSFLESAIVARYAPDDATQRAAFLDLADHLEARMTPERQAELLTYLLVFARDFDRLERTATDLDWVVEHMAQRWPLGPALKALEETGRDAEALMLDALERRLSAAPDWTEREFDVARTILANLESIGAQSDRLIAFMGRYLEASDRARSDDAAESVQIREQIWRLRHARGDLEAQAALARDLVGRCERLFGPEHPRTIKARNSVGLAALDAGDYETARDAFSQVMDLSKRVMGEDHRDTIAVAGNLGVALLHLDAFEEAYDVLAPMVDIAVARFGRLSPDVIPIVNNLSEVYRRVGDIDAAKKLLGDLSRTSRETLGDHHPIALTLTSNYAISLSMSGALDDGAAALDLFRRVLDGRRARHGPDHTDTALATTNLGMTLAHMGRASEAAPYLREGVEIATRALGPDHPETLRHRGLLGSALTAAGDVDAGRTELEKTLAAQTALLGESHNVTLGVMGDLAVAARKGGDAAEAERLLRKILAIRRRNAAIDPAAEAEAEVELAITLLQTRRYVEARALLERALATRAELFGSENHQTETAREWLIEVLDAMGERDAVDDLRDRRSRRLDAALAAAPDDPTALLAAARDAMERDALDVAEERYDRLAELRRASDAPASDFALWNAEIGRIEVMRRRGQARRALEAAEAAAARLRGALGDGDELALSAELVIADVMSDAGDETRARALRESVLARSEASAGENAPATLKALEALAGHAWDADDFAGAERFYARLFEARARRLGPNGPETIEALARLGEARLKLGALARAETALSDAHRRAVAAFGAEDARTLGAAHSLADLLEAKGATEAALEAHAAVLSARAASQPPEHPNVLFSVFRVASLHGALGDFPRAIDELERAAETCADAYGETAITTAALASLAAQQLGYGALGAAEATCVRAAEMIDRARADASTLRLVRGRVLRALGDAEGARDALSGAREGFERLEGARLDSTLAAASTLSLVLADLGDAAGARALAADASARARALGVESAVAQVVLSDTARLLCRIGDGDEGVSILRDLARRVADAQGPSHPQVLSLVSALGWALAETGAAADALETLDAGLDAASSAGGRRRPEAVSLALERAAVLAQLGAGDDAVRAARRACDAVVDVYAPGSAARRDAFNRLGWAHSGVDAVAEAREAFRLADESARAVLRPGAGAVYAADLRSIDPGAGAEPDVRDDAASRRAERALRDALASRRRRFGDDHSAVRALAGPLAVLRAGT